MTDGFCYIWFELETGRAYVGSHNGTNPDYIASGVALWDIINDIGKDEFFKRWRRIIFYKGPNEKDVETRYILSRDVVNDPMWLNKSHVWDGGAVFGPEARRKNSERVKKAWADPDFRRKNSDAQKKRFEDPLERRKNSEAQKKRWADPELRRKQGERMKAHPKKTCPHCNRQFSPARYSHYHGDNCKHRVA